MKIQYYKNMDVKNYLHIFSNKMEHILDIY